MANMLGEVYLALANEYTAPQTQSRKQDNTKLLYHFNQAKINDLIMPYLTFIMAICNIILQ